MTADKQLDRGPRTLRQLTCDWEVEQLTPKLREYISARFREVYDSPADPGRTYLTVSMRPRERPGAIVAPLPVHYSVARVDIIEFERLCGRKVDMTRERLNYFGRSLDALLSLLDRGASRDDYAPNMMPYKYRAEEEVSGLIEEADEGQFGQVEGFRPIIVIDTAGALGENLLIVKAALKRMLYSFMVAKSRFNIVAFNGQGRATAWEDRLVPPVAQKLREAEDFLDSLRPGGARGTDILEAMGWALEPSDADAVYLLSSGFPKRADVPYCLASIRSRNMRQLPIHVIGVDCDTKSELDLRRLAEENRGSFRQKKFNLRASVSMPVSELLAASGHVKQPSGRKNGDQPCWTKAATRAATKELGPRRSDPAVARLAGGATRAAAGLRATICRPRVHGADGDSLRRPSIANPWDRPTGVVKVSQLAANATRSSQSVHLAGCTVLHELWPDEFGSDADEFHNLSGAGLRLRRGGVLAGVFLLAAWRLTGKDVPKTTTASWGGLSARFAVPPSQQCDFFIFTHVGNAAQLDTYLAYPLEDLLVGGFRKGVMVMYVMPKKEWAVMLKYVEDLVANEAAPEPKELQVLNQTCHEKMERADTDAATHDLHRIRMLSPLDFRDTLLSIRYRLGPLNFQQWLGHTTYDAPKLVDAIMRVRALGNGFPVFRFDIDVICNAYTKDSMASIKEAVYRGVEDYKASIDDPMVQSFVLSQQYAAMPASDKSEFNSWNEAFSTRANPALLATPALCNATQWKADGSWGKFLPSPGELTAATHANVLMAFYGLQEVPGHPRLQAAQPSTSASAAARREEDILKLGNTFVGANPMRAIISGAALATGPGVTLDLPPFLHTDLNIMWIDDHCLDRMTREIMGTKRNALPSENQARVVKARPQPSNVAKYTLEVYMPTLLYGIIMDRWINSHPDSYLLKYNPSDLPDMELFTQALAELMPADGRAQGPFTRAMQEVRNKALMLDVTATMKLKAELWSDACARLQDMFWQWSHLPEPEVEGQPTPTFASLWATGRVCSQPGLESYCSNPGYSKLGQGLVSPSWHAEARATASSRATLPALTRYDLNPALATKVDELVESAVTYLQWFLEWPRVVQAIRDERIGRLPSDVAWRVRLPVPTLG
ncbi:unnamed protein product [Polarella glacialis]|uniref:VWFA domain-containing protein n=1 Tax=Polarella glacialis TaxID=89957 RepID=A0A813F4U2_POLGL|nr:unnamed protein product [Polarella glacialis]